MSDIRRFSNSEIQVFKACRRKWWLTYYRGLRPREEPMSTVKHTGTRVHAVLEKIYAPGGPYLDEEMALATHVEIVSRTIVPEHEQADAEKAFDLERAMITGYLEWLADTGADAALEVIAPETIVEVEFFGARLIGKLDAQVLNTMTGRRSFIDHKTVADFSAPERAIRQNEQMMFYQLLQHIAYPEQASGWSIFNMLRRVRRTARAKPPFYQRIEIFHNHHVREHFDERLYFEIEDIRRAEKNLDRNSEDDDSYAYVAMYPRPSRDCSWSCPFVGICTMFDDGSRVEDAIESQFTTGDPLDYYQDLGKGNDD